jgi:hypothetical protein
MDITRNFEDIGDNFRHIRDKILNLIRFWERFKLSMPRRISIAKTFLVFPTKLLRGCFQATSNSTG